MENHERMLNVIYLKKLDRHGVHFFNSKDLKIERASADWNEIDVAHNWGGGYVVFPGETPSVLLVDFGIGGSVTNQAEHIASAIIRIDEELASFPDKRSIQWFELYSSDLDDKPDWRKISSGSSVDQILFDWSPETSRYRNPGWKSFSLSTVSPTIASFIKEALPGQIENNREKLEEYRRDNHLRCAVLGEAIDSLIRSDNESQEENESDDSFSPH